MATSADTHPVWPSRLLMFCSVTGADPAACAGLLAYRSGTCAWLLRVDLLLLLLELLSVHLLMVQSLLPVYTSCVPGHTATVVIPPQCCRHVDRLLQLDTRGKGCRNCCCLWT